jgi:hypothetical protein
MFIAAVGGGCAMLWELTVLGLIDQDKFKATFIN